MASSASHAMANRSVVIRFNHRQVAAIGASSHQPTNPKVESFTRASGPDHGFPLISVEVAQAILVARTSRFPTFKSLVPSSKDQNLPNALLQLHLHLRQHRLPRRLPRRAHLHPLALVAAPAMISKPVLRHARLQSLSSVCRLANPLVHRPAQVVMMAAAYMIVWLLAQPMDSRIVWLVAATSFLQRLWSDHVCFFCQVPGSASESFRIRSRHVI